jgi:hypothetical protein
VPDKVETEMKPIVIQVPKSSVKTPARPKAKRSLTHLPPVKESPRKPESPQMIEDFTPVKKPRIIKDYNKFIIKVLNE